MPLSLVRRLYRAGLFGYCLNTLYARVSSEELKLPWSHLRSLYRLLSYLSLLTMWYRDGTQHQNRHGTQLGIVHVDGLITFAEKHSTYSRPETTITILNTTTSSENYSTAYTVSSSSVTTESTESSTSYPTAYSSSSKSHSRKSSKSFSSSSASATTTSKSYQTAYSSSSLPYTMMSSMSLSTGYSISSSYSTESSSSQPTIYTMSTSSYTTESSESLPTIYTASSSSSSSSYTKSTKSFPTYWNSTTIPVITTSESLSTGVSPARDFRPSKAVCRTHCLQLYTDICNFSNHLFYCLYVHPDRQLHHVNKHHNNNKRQYSDINSHCDSAYND